MTQNLHYHPTGRRLVSILEKDKLGREKIADRDKSTECTYSRQVRYYMLIIMMMMMVIK